MFKLKNIVKYFIVRFFWSGKKTFKKMYESKEYFERRVRWNRNLMFKNSKFFLYNSASLALIKQNEDGYVEKIYNKNYSFWNEETKIVFLLICFNLGFGSLQFIEELLKIAEETSSNVNRLYLALSIDKLIFRNSFHPQQDFYIRRRCLFKQICSQFDLRCSVSENKNESKRKIKLCIITYLMDDSIRNSAQRVLKMHIDNLDYSKFEVFVVCIDAFKKVKDGNICNIEEYVDMYQSYFDKKDSIANMLGNNIEILYSSGNNARDILQSSLDNIFRINPDLILDMTDDYSVLSTIYNDYFPTVQTPLRSHSFTNFCKYYIATPEITRQDNNYYLNVLEDTKIINWCFPEYVMPCNTTYTRAENNLSQDDFIMVTAGTIPAYDHEFYSVISKILESDEKIKYIVVGDNVPAAFLEFEKNYIDEGRIILWGYEKQLPALYRICNVFINPRRTGGSGTIAIAAQQGLPILMTTFHSDALRWIPLENCISTDYDGFEKEIRMLKNDENYYDLKSKLFKTLVDIASDDETIWEKFNFLLEDIYNGK